MKKLSFLLVVIALVGFISLNACKTSTPPAEEVTEEAVEEVTEEVIEEVADTTEIAVVEEEEVEVVEE